MLENNLAFIWYFHVEIIGIRIFIPFPFETLASLRGLFNLMGNQIKYNSKNKNTQEIQLRFLSLIPKR